MDIFMGFAAKDFFATKELHSAFTFSLQDV